MLRCLLQNPLVYPKASLSLGRLDKFSGSTGLPLGSRHRTMRPGGVFGRAGLEIHLVARD